MGRMETLTRRRLCLNLSCAAAAPAQLAVAQANRTPLQEARSFPLSAMRVRKLANGGESRDALRGTLPTGEAVAVHETTLPVGSAPSPRHTIEHAELILIREGTVEFQHGDASENVSAGGVLYVARGTLHALRNAGDLPAKYFVVAMGGDIAT